MVVFAVDISRRMIELRRTSLQCGRRTLLESAVQQHQRNGSAHVPAGTPWRSGSERYRELCGGSGIRVEEFAALKHRMHYNRQFACHGHGSCLEADPLSELPSPRAQSAVG